MKLFVLLIIFFSFNSPAQTSCGLGFNKIRKGAKINFLDLGSHIIFLKDIQLPSFETKRKIANNIWVKYPASNQSQIIKSGTSKKVIRVNATEDGYILLLDNFYPIFIENQYPKYEIETVGSLEKASNFSILICKNS